MNSGGHSGYFDVYSDIDQKELYNSLIAIGAKKFAINLQVAIEKGIKDDYEKTDNLFYNLHPSLGNILEEYVENNKDKIF